MLKIRDRSVYSCYIFLTCSFLLVFFNTEVVATDQSTPNTEKEYIYLPLAFSIVPQISPVEYEPNEVPHLSFNLLAGYYAKLDGFELGGLANLETEEVYGVQLAGLTNVVGGKVKGFQAAAGLNLGRTDLKGLQVALGANIVGGNVEGFQAAYGFNLAGSNLDGIQISGAANIADGYVEGAQGSYGFNIARGDLKGLQVARGANVAGGSVRGFQGAFGLNLGSDIYGLQLSALNIARGRVGGTQIGVINIARSMTGFQLGVVNISGSNTGTSIGLFSFAKSKSLHPRFWTTDTENANVGLRFGSSRSYNLLMVGAQQNSDPMRWSYGIGMGGHTPLSEHFFMNIDGVVRHVHYGVWDKDNQDNFLTKLRVAIGWEQYQRLSAFAGITLNVFLSGASDASDFAYGLDYLTEWGDVKIRLWPGVFAGVQF